MIDWQQLAEALNRRVREGIALLKRRRREQSLLALAALLFYVGYSFPGWLPAVLSEWLDTWRGRLVIAATCWVVGSMFLFWAGLRIWRLVLPRPLPPVEDRPAAIKGPMPFTAEDGPLFRELGREDEIQRLLGWVQDDQVPLVVVWGASGAGKTSLLRAGLSHVLADKNVAYHYWEAVPKDPGNRLLRALRESWHDCPPDTAKPPADAPEGPVPESLDDLVDPSSDLCARHHVIVLDQLEQLRSRHLAKSPIFRLLRRVARESRPPHRVTWIVAFRREFSADWQEFILPEHERGFYPRELPLGLFSQEQGKEVAYRLVGRAGLSVEEKVVDGLIEDAAVEGEVSPVDIGIGLQVLAELHARQAGRTLTVGDYRFAGGSEGLLTEYLRKRLALFPEGDRDKVLLALLALRDPETHQRFAEGRTSAELADEARADEARLRVLLDRLAQRDVRVLEKVEPSEASEAPRYRLAHERLIPALHRLTGQFLAEVDQARLTFEAAFRAWQSRRRGSQYLLAGKELRLIERYEREIPWGQDADRKRKFLAGSRRRRRWKRLASAAMMLVLTAAVWSGKAAWDREGARREVLLSGYPEGLYDWQHQLRTLELDAPFDLERLSWLHSRSIEELHLTTSRECRSIAGLATLRKCPALKRLTLDLSDSLVHDLTPLAGLSEGTEVSLLLRATLLEDSPRLAEVSGLRQLTLFHSYGKKPDLTPLAKLSGVRELSISFEADVPDFTPLEKMSGLTQLSLHFTGTGLFHEIPTENLKHLENLKELENLSGLTELSVHFDGCKAPDLTPLAKLSRLTRLSLDFRNSSVPDLTPLEKLSELTRLSLHFTDHSLPSLTSLEKVSGLTELSVWFNGGKAPDLTPLAKLSRLTRLSLRFFGIAPDLTPLAKLSGLRELSVSFEGDVPDLTPLAKLSGLTTLSLSLRVGGADFRSLQEGTRLDSMVDHSNPDDLTRLPRLSVLTQLSLRLVMGSRVFDLKPLEELSGLTRLELVFFSNAVIQLDVLRSLPELQDLEVRGTTPHWPSLPAIAPTLTRLRLKDRYRW